MKIDGLRKRLQDYICSAGDKEIQIIYALLLDDTAEEKKLWNSPSFVCELEKEYEAWDAGNDMGYSLADIKNELVNREAKQKGGAGLHDRDFAQFTKGPNNYAAYVESKADIMLGKPVIRNTRITVAMILKKLSEGASFRELIAAYPEVTEASINAALAYASEFIDGKTAIDRK